MIIKQKYLDLIKQGKIQSDDAQLKVVSYLEQLYHSLNEKNKQNKKKIIRLSSFFDLQRKKNNINKIKSIYIWGGVGRGKTFLMDLAYSCFHDRAKRYHFHEFMQYIHKELQKITDHENPLSLVAKKIKKDVDIIFFDEFFIVDIGDAMIMYALIENLFLENIVLVFTSNFYPDNLYKNGLQRARFIPCIELIKKNCHIVNLDSPKDYRLLFEGKTKTFFYPMNEELEKSFELFYFSLSKSKVYSNDNIIINNRPIECTYFNESNLYISFHSLFFTNRSQIDYIEIAKKFSHIFLYDVSTLDDQCQDVVRRFISFIDIMYDEKINLFMLSNVQLQKIYQGKRLNFEFQRCLSRLNQMMK
ncbi:cell division protein ZapE [Paraphotobacterium marinum]|uniref:Cell division protein ZapE n=1 Tax=Paraphotobacterium marinum TaxID=1755811 RepID=A0A220VCB7_9GAMM|nr:cell division protein ZapE [Paraphotobacterium marinum]ASK77940.1 cell division protein ZapE [Paraphotobacterium marinum]